MTLLSVRSHRRRGQGCSFIADESGSFLTFPTFILDIDDSEDCVLPCTAAGRTLLPNYRESASRCLAHFSHVDVFRIGATRAQGTTLFLSQGGACRVGVSPPAETNPAELRPGPSAVPKVLLSSPLLERNVGPHVRPCEIPESSAAATARYTPQQLHKLLGCRSASLTTNNSSPLGPECK
jgi:hypothetical protein